MSASFDKGKPDPGPYLRSLARWLDAQVVAAMNRIPPASFS